MRITLTVDSATPDEVYDLTLAFQRTRNIPLPKQIGTEPSVQVMGTHMTWTSPAMNPAQATAILAEFGRLRPDMPLHNGRGQLTDKGYER